MSDREFDTLFTTDRPVIFAYHGYPSLIHRLTYRRTNHANLHVRGFKEEGTTTTPFDMVMLNDLDRFRLVIDVIDRVPGLAARQAGLRQRMADARLARPGLDPRARRGRSRRSAAGPGRTTPAGNRVGAVGRPRRGHRRRQPVGRRRGRDGGVRMRVLVVNTGSSSVKLRLLDGTELAGSTDLGAPSTLDPSEVGDARRQAGRRVRCGRVLGHRIVHGGRRSPRRSWSTTGSGPSWRRVVDLAPLHLPASLAGLDAVRAALPSCRRWPASTPRSTPRSRPGRPRTRCRRSGATSASGGTASTGCPTRTRPAGRRRSSSCRPTGCGW